MRCLRRILRPIGQPELRCTISTHKEGIILKQASLRMLDSDVIDSAYLGHYS